MAIAAEHADIGMVKVLAVLMPGCAIPVVGCGTGSDGNGLDVQRNLDVAGLTATDVSPPRTGSSASAVEMDDTVERENRLCGLRRRSTA